ncbi:MAG TPA: hypothetical protein VGF91_08055 [Solirubrobacteraceae bacterium]
MSIDDPDCSSARLTPVPSIVDADNDQKMTANNPQINDAQTSN